MAALVALGAGCSTTPKTYGPCHHVIVYPVGLDASGYVAAYDWDDDVHAYGESVPLKGCFTAPFVAVPEGPPGVTFDPVQQQAPADEFGVVNFTVTVSKGSSGPIFVRLDYTEGGTMATPPGPVITPSGDGWKFTFPPEPES